MAPQSLTFGTTGARLADVDGDAQVDRRRDAPVGFAIDLDVGHRHRTDLLHRLDHRPRGEVREAGLAAELRREVLIDDLAVLLQHLHGDDARRRRRGDAEALLHVGDDARRHPAQRLDARWQCAAADGCRSAARRLVRVGRLAGLDWPEALLEEPAPLLGNRFGRLTVVGVELLDVAGIDAEQRLEVDRLRVAHLVRCQFAVNRRSL
jgi:hypothetical protein